MTAARGDQKPCTRTGCPGTMQFGREPLPKGPTTGAPDGERGWVCSEKPSHFQREFEPTAPVVAAKGSALSGWDDDGGAERTGASQEGVS
jgi:hypothetical protein